MMTIAEAAAAYEKAKADLADAKEWLAGAEKKAKDAADAERAAYRAFNDAVDAMRPKRGPRPKKDGASDQ